jgi:hypothetical protein
MSRKCYVVQTRVGQVGGRQQAEPERNSRKDMPRSALHVNESHGFLGMFLLVRLERLDESTEAENTACTAG